MAYSMPLRVFVLTPRRDDWGRGGRGGGGKSLDVPMRLLDGEKVEVLQGNIISSCWERFAGVRGGGVDAVRRGGGGGG